MNCRYSSCWKNHLNGCIPWFEWSFERLTLLSFQLMNTWFSFWWIRIARVWEWKSSHDEQSKYVEPTLSPAHGFVCVFARAAQFDMPLHERSGSKHDSCQQKTLSPSVEQTLPAQLSKQEITRCCEVDCEALLLQLYLKQSSERTENNDPLRTQDTFTQYLPGFSVFVRD